MTGRPCVFCGIVAHTEPSEVLHEDEEVIVFRNHLRWAPVMLLAIPKAHMTQTQLWIDPVIAKVASVAAAMGAEHCPGGYRLLANFGPDAMQSQEHGHMHIVGGMHLGPYVRRSSST